MAQGPAGEPAGRHLSGSLRFSLFSIRDSSIFLSLLVVMLYFHFLIFPSFFLFLLILPFARFLGTNRNANKSSCGGQDRMRHPYARGCLGYIPRSKKSEESVSGSLISIQAAADPCSSGRRSCLGGRKFREHVTYGCTLLLLPDGFLSGPAVHISV